MTDSHIWHTYDERDGTVCTKCGIVRRADGKNKSCPGRTPPITTRTNAETEIAELRRWLADGKAPAGSCPFCASRISMIQRDEYFIARCSHRGCGAVGPKMRNITRAADLFCCPPPRTAGGRGGAAAGAGRVASVAALSRLRGAVGAVPVPAGLPRRSVRAEVPHHPQGGRR